MNNSPLVSYTKISPNKTSPRTMPIDRVSIHCVVGQCSVEALGNVFAPAERKASSNYGVGKDGRIGLYVEEKDRSWCTSSSANDNRAVTIEVASDTTAPYAVTAAAMEGLIKLLVDIAQRNGKHELVWIADKDKALTYQPKTDELLMTVHRWFANKACPGDYLYERHGQIAAEVNKRLKAAEASTGKLDNTPADWAREGVDWAVRNQLMVGDGNGDLKLHDNITREQFCVMLQRYHENRGNLV